MPNRHRLILVWIRDPSSQLLGFLDNDEPYLDKVGQRMRYTFLTRFLGIGTNGTLAPGILLLRARGLSRVLAPAVKQLACS